MKFARVTLFRYFMPLLVIAMLNGALFNRIGQRLAKRSYIKVVLYYAVKLFDKDAVYDGPAGIINIKYSKRHIPTSNSASANPQTQLNLITEISDPGYKCQSDHLSAVASLWLSMFEAKLCKPYKEIIIKPPI